MSPPRSTRKSRRSSPGARGRRPASPWAPILADARRWQARYDTMLDDTMLNAELWASHLLGAIWHQCWEAADDGIGVDDEEEAAEDIAHELLHSEVDRLIRYLSAEGSPTAMWILGGLASVGEQHPRRLAARAVDELVRRGVVPPAWWPGHEARLTGAYQFGEQLGDIELTVLGFARDGAEHMILLAVVRLAAPTLVRIQISPLEAGETVHAIAKGLVDVDGAPLESLTGAQVRARLERPLASLLVQGPDVEEMATEVIAELIGDEDKDGDAAAGWPLLRSRLDLLPDHLVELGDDLDQRRAACEQATSAFVDSPWAADLPDRALARAWGRFASEWSWNATLDPVRYGFISLAYLLAGEVAEHVIIDAADVALLPDVVRAWAHFTIDARDLGTAELHAQFEEQLTGMLADFVRAYADPDLTSHRLDCPDSYRLRGATPPAGAATVHQINVSLRRSRPRIWRRLLVASATTLAELHQVIQAAFDWDDDHLWVFRTGSGQFGTTPSLGHRDPSVARLDQIGGEGTRFGYLFDFGDEWDHEILVEKVEPADPHVAYPTCVGGSQPDPVQYPHLEDDFDDVDDQPPAIAFDRNLINTRLADLRNP